MESTNAKSARELSRLSRNDIATLGKEKKRMVRNFRKAQRRKGIKGY